MVFNTQKITIYKEIKKFWNNGQFNEKQDLKNLKILFLSIFLEMGSY